MRRFVALSIALLALAPAASALATTSGQRLFSGLILRDAKVSGDVKALLRAQGGFVDARIIFGDFTGDGRADAVVLVGSGGAPGDVAVYSFSSDGRNGRRGSLRAVYREESRYRISVRSSNGVLTVRTPNYAGGGDVCCPASLIDRDLRWNKRTGAFRVTARRRVALGR